MVAALRQRHPFCPSCLMRLPHARRKALQSNPPLFRKIRHSHCSPAVLPCRRRLSRSRSCTTSSTPIHHLHPENCPQPLPAHSLNRRRTANCRCRVGTPWSREECLHGASPSGHATRWPQIRRHQEDSRGLKKMHQWSRERHKKRKKVPLLPAPALDCHSQKRRKQSEQPNH